MLDTLPRESEQLSWLYVALWALLIYSTIPFAPFFAQWFAGHFGSEYFFYVGAAAGLIALILALANLRGRNLSMSSYIWLTGVTITFVAYAYRLREVPVEVIHLVEYVILSVLVYRALVHRIRDYSIYFVATFIVAIIGIVEECIQWIVPSRVFDLRDIQTNLVAGGLVQLAIATGLRPTLVGSSPPQ